MVGCDCVSYYFLLVSKVIERSLLFLSSFVSNMYNHRARARTAFYGSIGTQGVGVRGSPTLVSQVTLTQALQILDTDEENVEMIVSEASEVSAVNADQNIAKITIKSDVATQPPIHANITHSEATQAQPDLTYEH